MFLKFNHCIQKTYRQSNRTNKQFKVIHCNCNSVKNKVNELKQFLSSHSPDIMFLNEIKCNNYWANELLVFENYNTIFKCRSNFGGGIALLIKNCYVFTEIYLKNCFNSPIHEEVIGLNIVLNKTTHSFFSYYNPPNCKLNYALFE